MQGRSTSHVVKTEVPCLKIEDGEEKIHDTGTRRIGKKIVEQAIRELVELGMKRGNVLLLISSAENLEMADTYLSRLDDQIRAKALLLRLYELKHQAK